MITSIQNPKLKWVRTLLSKKSARYKEKVFVCEGVRLAEEALAIQPDVPLVLFSSAISERGRALLERTNADIYEVAPDLLDRISATEVSQGILLVSSFISLPLPQQPDFLLLLDELRDPGNMGTIMRAAVAFNLQALLYTPGTVDPYSPKVVRSAMGAHFRLPLLQVVVEDIPTVTKGTTSYLAEVNEGIPCWQADLTQPTTIIIGSEAHGASQEVRKSAHHNLLIPMPGSMESLNAAMSANIFLYEVNRQRTA